MSRAMFSSKVRRLLSAVLAFALMFSLLPQIELVASAAAPATQTFTYKYLDLRMKDYHTTGDNVSMNNKGVDPTTITSFDMTSGDTQIHPNTAYKTAPWHYVGVKNSNLIYASTVYGSLSTATNADNYVRIAVRISEDGTYNIKGQHLSAATSAAVKYWLAPMSASDPMADEYFLGRIDTMTATQKNENIQPIGTAKLTKGDYYFTYSIDSFAEGRVTYFATQFTFAGAADGAVAGISADAVSIGQYGVATNEISATLTDGSAASAGSLAFSVYAENPDIADVSVVKTDSGKALSVTGLAKGSTDVILTASDGTNTYSCIVPVTVGDPAKYTYNWRYLCLRCKEGANGVDDTTMNNKGVDVTTITSFDMTSGPNQIHPNTSRKTDPWHYVQHKNSVFVFASYVYGIIFRSQAASGATATMKIRVPQSGTYTVGSMHLGQAQTAMVNLYISPDKATDYTARKYYVGTINSNEVINNYARLDFGAVYLDAGDYNITYEIASHAEGRTDYGVAELTLTAREPIPPSRLSAEDIPANIPGETELIPLSFVDEAGEPASLDGYTVTAASSKDGVVNVSIVSSSEASGKALRVDYVASGTADITVTATKGEESHTYIGTAAVGGMGKFTYNYSYLDLRMKDYHTTGDNVSMNNKGVDPKTITSFDMVSGDNQIHPNTAYPTDPWHHVTLSGADYAYTSTVYATLIRAKAADGWVRNKIRVGRSGTYNVYGVHYVDPNTAEYSVYIAPADAADPMAADYLVGTVDTSGTKTTGKKILVGEGAKLTRGDYLITYQIKSVAAGRTDLCLTQTILEQTAPIKNTLKAAEEVPSLVAGRTASVGLSMQDENGNPVSLEGYTITVKSNDASVADATVDGTTLNISYKKTGSTILIVTAEKDGSAVIGSVQVTVAAPAKYVYNLLYLDLRMKDYNTTGDNVSMNNKGVDPTTITSYDMVSGPNQIHPNTIRTTHPWHYVSHSGGAYAFTSSTYATLLRSQSEGAYVQLKLKVDKDGLFAASEQHFGAANSATVNYYLAPDGVENPMAPEYYIGTVDTTKKVGLYQIEPINTVDLTAGDWILTAQNASHAEGRTDYCFTQFILTETNAPATVEQFYADELPVRLVGSESTVDIHAIRNDGSIEGLGGFELNVTSSDPTVAAAEVATAPSGISKILTVKYLKKGSTKLTLTATDGKTNLSYEANVVVSDGTGAVAGLTLETVKTSISVGGMTGTSVTATLEDGYKVPYKTPVYASSNTDVAYVDEEGTIHAVGAGTTKITAAGDGKTSNEVTLTVTAAKLNYNLMKVDLYRAKPVVDDKAWNKGVDPKTVTSFEMTIEGHKNEVNPQSQISTAPWHFVSVDGTFGFYSSTYGTIFIPGEEGNKLKLNLRVAADGKYQPVHVTGTTTDSGIFRYYLAPVDAVNPTADEYFIGVVDNYAPTVTWHAEKKLKPVELEAGDYTLTYEYVGANPRSTAKRNFIEAFRLDDLKDDISIELAAEAIPTANPGFETEILIYGNASNGYIHELSGAEITAVSADESVAKVKVAEKSEKSDIGRKMTYTAVSSGGTTITVNAVIDGVTYGPLEIPVTVKTPVLETLDVSVYTENINLNRDPVQISIDARDPDGDKIYLTPDMLSFDISDESVVSVDEMGAITPIAEGEATIGVSVTVGGKTLSGEVSVTVRRSKTGRTFYTEDKLDNARDNIANLDWARKQSEDAAETADYYVRNLDKLYNLIPSEGLPRAASVGFVNDPMAYTCRYCLTDLRDHYGSYSWLLDPINEPWKIQCPACRRKFPSNDFESFYKLGINEYGMFDRKLALEKNAELVAQGQDGFLKNILYPEAKDKFGDANWGVDDGMGYRTGKLSGGVTEAHTYIAYYQHYGLWQNASGVSNSGVILNAIIALRDAYLYTDNAKYGNAGSILLDRIADVYPTYDLYQYFGTFANSHGGSGEGNIIGRIWEPGMMNEFILAYDAFYPAMDNPEVINYLSAKAALHNDNNPKTSGDMIRRNCEDGILRDVFKSVKTADVCGNFGMHQMTLAYDAVVLDSMPESAEMIDFMLQAGAWSSRQVTGGDVMPTLINRVCRDGFGDESGPGYNRIWMENIMDLAEAMADYTGYEVADFYSNPKVQAMITSYAHITLIRQGAPDIGDSGGTSGIQRQQLKIPRLISAYQRTGNPEYAQLIWYLNGNKADGLTGDIFSKNPNQLAEDVRRDVKLHGEWDFDSSEMLAGYGLNVLRRGSVYKTTGTNGNLDLQRDFWIYSGKTSGHGHEDALNLGMDAFGVNLAPDLGYPEATGSNTNRYTWVRPNISHNTVVVDEKEQTGVTTGGNPMHFDSASRVQVMEVSDNLAYPDIDEYKRTLVMVDVDGANSYGVDFFRVTGGDDHLFSFHAMSRDSEVVDFEGFTPAAQVDADGNYVGCYAGADVPWGDEQAYSYPAGYTWLKNVRRADDPQTGKFSIDFPIYEHNNIFPRPMDLHLKMTMVNDFDLSEITVAHGTPPRVVGNPSDLTYVLARRTGENLDTLFTTVFQPYVDSAYLADMHSFLLTDEQGAAAQDAKAVKVIHNSGRVDYVFYAEDNTVKYTLTDGDFTAAFRGFVGVITIDSDGQIIYSYVNDGDIIGEDTSRGAGAYTGTVADFSQELTNENHITVTFDSEVDAENIAGRHIYVENGEYAYNAAYPIVSVDDNGDGTYKLNLGNKTLIRSLIDNTDFKAGYNYNIAEGNTFRIPLSFEEDGAPVFTEIGSVNIAANHKMTMNISAESPLGREVTYSAAELPRGAAFDAASGTVTWTPDENQIGEHVIAINATDGSLVSTQYIEVVVFKSSGALGGSSSAGTTKPTQPTQPSKPSTDDNKGEENKPDTPVKPDDTTETDGFTDLGGYDWAKDSIENLASKGVVNGTGATTFAPGINITRADFAIMMVRAFGLESDSTENFADVAPSAYYAKELAIAKAHGIINGVGENKYDPTATITRQDMMTVVSRALVKFGYELEEAGEDTLAQFTDSDDIADYALEHVARLVANGIIKGKTESTVDPTAFTTRAEVAVLIERLMKTFLEA